MNEKESLEEEFKKEVLKTIDSKEEQKLMEEWIEEGKVTIDFMEKINDVEIPDSTNYVIFTDGEEQLVYENGEFYVVSTTSSLRKKVKKTKKEATDMYLDYFIKYQLNPLLDARNLSDEKIKEQQREKELAEKIAKQEVEKAKIIEESKEYDEHSPQDRMK
ncbi:MAG: hypothetical protein IKD74_07690 [Clostridia bacterium]|jgi:hypothetical protein|nr:hypothetical protein [Clostridia bacterium]